MPDAVLLVGLTGSVWARGARFGARCWFLCLRGVSVNAGSRLDGGRPHTDVASRWPLKRWLQTPTPTSSSLHAGVESRPASAVAEDFRPENEEDQNEADGQGGRAEDAEASGGLYSLQTDSLP